MKKTGAAVEEKPVGDKSTARKPARWPYALACALFAALSAYEFHFYDTVPAAYDWSVRFAVVAVAVGVCAVWPGIGPYISQKLLWLTEKRHAPESERKHYPIFDLLRLLFALCVIFEHGWNSLGSKIWIPAVPMFLALSGFMVLQSMEHSRNWLHFAWKRLLRVGPAFCASLLTGGLLFGWAYSVNTVCIWATLGLTIPVHRDFSRGFNGVFWSLGWEELYYAVLAVAFWLGIYNRPRLLTIILVWSIFREVNTANCTARVLNSDVTLTPAFLIGNLAYIYRERIGRLPKLLPLLLWGSLAVTFPFRVVGGWTTTAWLRGIYAATPQTMAVHEIALLIVTIWLGINGPSIRRIRMPDLSYGLYVYGMYALSIASHQLGAHTRIPLIVEALPIAASMAATSWYIVERPALRLKDVLKGPPVITSGGLKSEPTDASQAGQGGIELAQQDS